MCTDLWEKNGHCNGPAGHTVLRLAGWHVHAGTSASPASKTAKVVSPHPAALLRVLPAALHHNQG